MNRTVPSLSAGAWARVTFYGLAGLAGAALTARFNVQWSEDQGGFNIADYVRAGFANSASTSFSIDLIVAATVGVLFMAVEGARLRIRMTTPLILTAFLIAFAFAFPAFLAVRELKLGRLVDIAAGTDGSHDQR